MPKLFISYKRKTDGVEKLKADLRTAKYGLWFDRDDIHLGSEDWQADIERGIEGCAGLILCLTPAACTSEPIKFEVNTARRLNKPIFPILLETLADIPAGLRDIGLPERQHVEPFTSLDTWDEQFAKLLTSLRERGLGVTPHDLRQKPDEKEHRWHQDYLDKVIRQVGRLPLAAINPKYTHAEGAPLEDVYIPLPVKYALSIEVRDYRIDDWWIGEVGKDGERRYRYGTAKPEDYPPSTRRRPADLGWKDVAALEALIDQRQIKLDQAKAAKEKGVLFYGQVEDGVYPNDIPLDFEAAAAACNRLVLLGSPGSGKTIAGRHLALCLAGVQRKHWTRTATLAGLGHWPYNALTPVYVELRALVSSPHFPQSLDVQPTADHLWAYIRHEVLGEALADYAPILADDLKSGSAVLILDGLDEVPYPRGKGNLQKRQTQLKTLARAIDDAYGGIRVIVTSRPYAYEGWSLPGYSSVELAPFADAQRIGLAGNLYRCGGDPADAAQARAGRLNEALQPVDAELKDRPLFVTLMATLFAAGENGEGLPTRKGALYRESILLLLDRWTTAKPGAPTLTTLLGNASRADLLDRLGALAYDVHEQLGVKRGTPEIPRALLSQHIFEMEMDDPSIKAAQLVSYLSENAGILVSPGHVDAGAVFHFAHRTFQEYLAARHIVRLCKNDFTPVRDHITSRPQLWRFPCLLVGDVLRDRDDAKNAYDDLWALLEDLLYLEDDVPETVPKDDPRWWSIWLAARIAAEQELHTQKVKPSRRAIRDGLIDWLVRLVETARALDPVERADCGRTLGLLGDPREGVGVRTDGLPDIVWCDIPADDFLMGSDPAKDPQADTGSYNETPQQRVHLDAYRVSKYLVTYQQYAAFVRSDGYTKRDYWTEAGWEWKGDNMTQPNASWNHRVWHVDNHPVVGVTWYEAHAFCCWLTAQYHAANLLPHDWGIRLLTEAEYERAARGTDGLIFPYGDTGDPAKGNHSETNIGRTSAVGLFPDGMSPYAALDMSGNVWCWCLTAWRDSYAAPEDNQPEGNSTRVLRGGSWRDDVQLARAASRLRLDPVTGLRYFGFRVCCAPIEKR
ncbi:MAG: SUMF1/EgtB/PvdO family nonheme iron enzyme [Chloroflexi bacterium]|uniref:SUMF1/EgtB/PvdO family nonheme iron enzyme n=1 Tax=Candidatus Flexifilum breve TaxID=3140694 RepID=UPI0031365FEE|nr:SUMF1/EgtB/PvdO family nonheme iron enzyme [Chloroflexota bacterium]